MKNGEIPADEPPKPGGKCCKLIRKNKLVVFLICCVIISVVAGVLQIIVVSSLFVEKERHFRLPINLIPSHYSLEIKPYIIPGNFKFEGKVEITLTCVEKTDEIVLHSRGLEINEDTVNVEIVGRRERLEVLRIKYDKENQFLILQLWEDLKQNGVYRISISYQGALGEEAAGFYVSSYKDDNGITHYTASTQFKSLRAREAFPCFDEPAMKATFAITIVRWKNMTSLSNMNKTRIEPRGRYWDADIYGTTLMMPTYLVAFVVGNYVGKSNGKITVWSHPDEENFTDFALDTSSNILKFYEDRLQSFVPPKLDLVPVTELYTDAIENWGLIIFYNSYLLYDGDKKDIRKRKQISSTIGHEIAHQWFGNLVTPKWWSDVWLSEGMSTYMENIASKALYPQWYQLDKTVESTYTGVVQRDCHRHKALHKTVNKKIADSQLFDAFGYAKGAIIMRMAHYLVGDDTFWKGLSMYLSKYAYGNTEENDLWECFNKAHFGVKPKLNMTEIMTSWTHLGGLPIVTVERDYFRQRVTYSQKSCNPLNDDGFENDMWNIPIFYTTADERKWNPKVSLWLKDRNVTVDYMPNESKWMLINGQGVGYYIVNYDRKNWNLLAYELRKNHQIFPPDQRFKLMADANILLAMDYLSIDTVLDLSLYYPKETKFSIISSTNVQFIWENWFLMEQSIYAAEWRDYIIYLFRNVYDKILEEKDNDEMLVPKELREFATAFLCFVNYKPCVDEAMRKYDLWKSFRENDTVDEHYGSETGTQICTTVKYGQNEVWEYIYEAYLNTSHETYLEALACTRDINLTRRVIKVVFEEIKAEQSFSLYVLAVSTNWAELLIYIRENFDELSSNDEIFKHLILGLENMFQGPIKYEQILSSFKKLVKTLSGWKAEKLREMLDGMEKKLLKMEKQKDVLETWLERQPWLQA